MTVNGIFRVSATDKNGIEVPSIWADSLRIEPDNYLGDSHRFWTQENAVRAIRIIFTLRQEIVLATSSAVLEVNEDTSALGKLYADSISKALEGGYIDAHDIKNPKFTLA